MNSEETSNSIPDDLILEILSRLPTKSIGRFRCVSKLWRLMLYKPYFTKLFLTRSSARPRLLIGVIQNHEWSFFSAPQPQNHYGKSSLVVAADFHMKSSIDLSFVTCRYVSGLLYFPTMLISNMDKDEAGVICNPTTRQFAILPQLRFGPVKAYGLVTCKDRGGLIGFDPIGGQFKVLSINNIVDSKMVSYILTLGSENERWRKIECPFNEDDSGGRSNDVFINGILYYIAYDPEDRLHLIGCFDVRSEKFKFLTLRGGEYDLCTRMINYKGKLGVIKWKYAEDGGFPLELCMWVLEDVEKQEWSKYAYTLKADNTVVKVNNNISVVGVTASGDIVLVKETALKPFYVFYFNPERNHLLSVEIQGLGEDHDWSKYHAVCAFVDHVEDLQFNVMKSTSL